MDQLTRPRSVAALAAGAALGAAALAACSPLPTACTLELGVIVTPVEPSIRAGESFTAGVEFTSCGGSERWRPDVTWTSSDTTVATVVPATGRVTGRAAGVATVRAVERSRESSGIPLTVRVTVRP